MMNQGRLATVIITLMVSMTVGAVVLLTLEGTPLKPMAFSLSSETRLNTSPSALVTDTKIQPNRWHSIEVSYETTEQLMPWNGQLCPRLAHQYHFVIDNGYCSADGQIYASSGWMEQHPAFDPGQQTAIDGIVRICLLAGANQPETTPQQAKQLEALIYTLQQHCGRNFPVHWNKL
ncbi:MAG: hypothetical protein JW709_10345 [Sedimentisphaerales bacterium]|nr:hypothetical protein [Sedimentisphaerales bacterium]